jgi:hypothetical protein
MENAVVKVKCNITTQCGGLNCDFYETHALFKILRKDIFILMLFKVLCSGTVGINIHTVLAHRIKIYNNIFHKNYISKFNKRTFLSAFI